MARRGRKRNKSKKRPDGQPIQAKSWVTMGNHEFGVTFLVGEPIDMEAVLRLSEQLREIREADFAFEEENELVHDLMEEADPAVRGAVYLQIAHNAGEPVVVEDGDTGESWELTLENGVIQQRKIRSAEFGVRDQKSNVNHMLDMADPPAHATAEERELWMKSPISVVRQGIADGDPRWENFVEALREDATEQEDMEEHTLRAFFDLQEVCYQMAKDKEDPKGEDAVKARIAWTFLQRARVFHIDASVYGEIYQACDRYCTTTLSGFEYSAPKWVGGKPVYELPEGQQAIDETEHHVKTLRAASPTAPMPEKWPFEVMFVGYGKGILLSDLQANGKFHEMGKVVPSNVKNVVITGALLTATGYVFEFYRMRLHDGTSGIVMESLRTPELGFIATFDLAPWYLPKLVEFIASHRMYVLEQDLSPDNTKRAKQVKRRTDKRYHPGSRWMPRPYYRMRMKHTVIQEKSRNLFPQPGKARTYRTDVVGHDRHLVRRGDLPLDPKQRAVLLNRGYQIFENTFLPAPLVEVLVRKGHHRKLPHEWMAVKEIWIDQHMNVNDESLPYVPALRTTGTGTGK